jgi:hypothetical protein
MKNNELIYIFNRDLAYTLMTKGFKVKDIQFNAESKTGFGFLEKEIQEDVIKFYKNQEQIT